MKLSALKRPRLVRDNRDLRQCGNIVVECCECGRRFWHHWPGRWERVVCPGCCLDQGETLEITVHPGRASVLRRMPKPHRGARRNAD